MDNPEPNFIGMASCKQEKFTVTYKEYSFDMKKQDFGLLVVLYDFLMVIIYLVFVIHLEKSQKEFIDEFKDQTIEMDDFAVEFINIPSDHFFSHDEHVLRAYIWRYCEEVMVDQYKINTLMVKNPKWYALPELHVADVNFSKKTNRDVDVLLELSKCRKQSRTEFIKRDLEEDDATKFFRTKPCKNPNCDKKKC